ncbi:MAG: hypothetical protein AB7F19_07240 [Candidatus Babeliales bacterium]
MNNVSLFRLSLLVFSFASIVIFSNADDAANSSNFGEKVKEQAKRGVEWTKEQCRVASEEIKKTAANGTAKWRAFTDEARAVANDRLGTNFTRKREENNPKPGRVQIAQQSPADIELAVPFEIKEGQKPTGSQPIVRGGRVLSEEVEISGEKVNILSTDLPNDASWFAWLETEEGKKFALGAIAVVTICGVTYLLYKNRVPQRIYGYVVKNPIRSLVSTACVLGVVAYIAQQRGITVNSVKDCFCLPFTA